MASSRAQSEMRPIELDLQCQVAQLQLALRRSAIQSSLTTLALLFLEDKRATGGYAEDRTIKPTLELIPAGGLRSISKIPPCRLRCAANGDFLVRLISRPKCNRSSGNLTIGPRKISGSGVSLESTSSTLEPAIDIGAPIPPDPEIAIT